VVRTALRSISEAAAEAPSVDVISSRGITTERAEASVRNRGDASDREASDRQASDRETSDRQASDRDEASDRKPAGASSLEASGLEPQEVSSRDRAPVGDDETYADPYGGDSLADAYGGTSRAADPRGVTSREAPAISPTRDSTLADTRGE